MPCISMSLPDMPATWLNTLLLAYPAGFCSGVDMMRSV
jgi:hypothetical protein